MQQASGRQPQQRRPSVSLSIHPAPPRPARPALAPQVWNFVLSDCTFRLSPTNSSSKRDEQEVGGRRRRRRRPAPHSSRLPSRAPCCRFI